jgi:hypothetical protein
MTTAQSAVVVKASFGPARRHLPSFNLVLLLYLVMPVDMVACITLVLGQVMQCIGVR